MRNAFSNLLGEYVGADQVEHADTHGFQVVCPCCRESVFKVRRDVSEFFSHRQAAKSAVTECERRVAGLSPTALAATNAASRGQTLKVFLSVIRDAVDLDDGHVGGYPADDGYHAQRKAVFASKTLAYFDEFFFYTHRDTKSHDWVADGIKMFNERNDQLGIRVGTSFNAAIQARIAGDVMRSMLTEQGKRNHAFLVRHALSRTIQISYEQGGAVLDGLSFIQKIKQAVNKGSEAAVRNALVAWDREPAPHGMFSYAAYARHRIEVEMFSTLMRLPYKEMLENHRLGLRPLTNLKERLRETYDAELGMGYAPKM